MAESDTSRLEELPSPQGLQDLLDLVPHHSVPSNEDMQTQWLLLYKAESAGHRPALDGANPIIYSYLSSELSANFGIPDIPTLILQYVWKIVPHPIRRKIKDWAKEATPEAQIQISNEILEYVEMALSSLGIPKFVIRMLIGPLIPKIVKWIVANVNQLDD